MGFPSGGGGGSSAPGFEIGYDQITASVNVTGTSAGSVTTIITCAAHTFDGSPVIFEFFAPFITLPTNGSMQIGLSEGSTSLGKQAFAVNPVTTADSDVPVSIKWRFTPTAGSHTYVVYAFVSTTTGTPAIGAGAAGADTSVPAYVRFTKV